MEGLYAESLKRDDDILSLGAPDIRQGHICPVYRADVLLNERLERLEEGRADEEHIIIPRRLGSHEGIINVVKLRLVRGLNTFDFLQEITECFR